MVKNVKVNNGSNYYFDTSTNDVVKKFDPNNKNHALVVKMEDGSSLMIEHDKIIKQYGGFYYFDYDEDRYMINDENNDILIRAGYIVLDNYDNIFIEDKEEGLKIRNDIFDNIRNSIFKELDNNKYSIDNKEKTKIKIIFLNGSFKYTVYINTINNIVNKNQNRKANNLPFYPFNKNMDKYGTLYCSIFCEKQVFDNVDNHLSYKLADEFISEFINILNADTPSKYHFSPLIIKRRLINSDIEGL
jgi:hypothetical protein